MYIETTRCKQRPVKLLTCHILSDYISRLFYHSYVVPKKPTTQKSPNIQIQQLHRYHGRIRNVVCIWQTNVHNMFLRKQICKSLEIYRQSDQLRRIAHSHSKINWWCPLPMIYCLSIENLCFCKYPKFCASQISVCKDEKLTSTCLNIFENVKSFNIR